MSFVNVDGSSKCIAVLTSGGDSQGMNAAIRAVVRMGIYANARVFAVYWGYQGLVDGGDNIKEMQWDDVTGIIHQGGTIIGSARCKDFRERKGRKKAALNLLRKDITNLVIIGGDGSLTGADIFRKEWPSLLEELVSEGEISTLSAEMHHTLNIVGMVGSIDNDFCGTDMTIGADSALHRIMESSDAIVTTAASHQRAFILEVMGRHCGYLALVAGLGSGADWIFLPECPAEDGWEERLCATLQKSRKHGRLLSIIILAEGARDIHGKSITSQDVKEAMTCRRSAEEILIDTRITVLGHVQRGGSPSAFDRVLATRFGAEAALTVLEATADTPSYVMCLQGQQIVKKPLSQCVDQCNKIKAAFEAKDFEEVVSLRGRSFQRNLSLYKTLRKLEPPSQKDCKEQGNCKKTYTLAVLTVGAPAGGMNQAVRSFVRSSLFSGHKVIAFRDGFQGLLKGLSKEMKWTDVDQWGITGGSNLGTYRTLPKENFDLVAERLQENGINGLLIVGGFEGYNAALQLAEARPCHPEFQIPIVVIPATMSNNIPGTYFSLGADTTLNVIVEACDRVRQSATSSQERVFVVETMGGKSGYLATMAGIAVGADSAYIFEEPFNANTLQNDIQHLLSKFKRYNIKRGLVLRNEKCNERYTTDFITSLYEEEASGSFITRKLVLGHIQQGGPPSPFDRMVATRQARRAMEFLVKSIEENLDEFGCVQATSEDTACVLGIIKSATTFSPVQALKSDTDFKNRIPKSTWWLNIRPLLRVMAQHNEVFCREANVSSSSEY